MENPPRSYGGKHQAPMVQIRTELRIAEGKGNVPFSGGVNAWGKPHGQRRRKPGKHP